MLRSELGQGERDRARGARGGRASGRRGRCRGIVTEAVGEAGVLDAHDDRVRRSAGRSYPDLVRLRSGGPGARAGRGACCPADAAQVERAARGLLARGRRPWCRSAGGTSVVGGVEPRCGGRREGDHAGPAAPAGGRGRSRLDDRDPRAGSAGPRGGGAPSAQGVHDRPLPAVVRVRDDRRLRSHPVGRPGLAPATGASTSWSPRSRLTDAGRRAAHAGDARTRRPARRCAS